MKDILKKIVDWIPLVGAIIATIVAIIKNRKSSQLDNKNSTMSAYDDMYNKMLSYVETAESMGNLLKSALGEKTGEYKLSSVLKDLKLYALTMKYDFDEQYWTDEVNNIVDFTKKVNVTSTENVETQKSECSDTQKIEENKTQGVIKR